METTKVSKTFVVFKDEGSLLGQPHDDKNKKRIILILIIFYFDVIFVKAVCN